MMDTIIPGKSILKQRTIKPDVTEADERKAKAERDKRNLDIALHHAYKIQNRKDAEAQILDSVIKLIDIPAANQFTAREATMFLELILSFQPSDFDNLVEERRIDGKCGYALCPNPPRRESLMLKIKPGSADWCSDVCARKGLYVKAQLSSVPVWERGSSQKPDVQLPEADQKKADELSESLEASAIRKANRAVRVEAWRQKIVADDQLEDLAAERGESVHSFRPGQILTDGIIERKTSSKSAKPPELEEDLDATFDAIEGYQPKRKEDDKNSDSDDD